MVYVTRESLQVWDGYQPIVNLGYRRVARASSPETSAPALIQPQIHPRHIPSIRFVENIQTPVIVKIPEFSLVPSVSHPQHGPLKPAMAVTIQNPGRGLRIIHRSWTIVPL